MSLVLRLKAITLHHLAHFNLIEDQVWHDSHWRQSEVTFLTFNLAYMNLSPKEFQAAVHTRILEIGKEMYGQTAGPQKIWADHVTSPHALAYAIQHKAFSWFQLRQIRFDDGDTAKTFMKDKVTLFLDDILAQLAARVPVRQVYPDHRSDLCCHN